MGILAMAAVLLVRPPGGTAGRFRRAVGRAEPGRDGSGGLLPGAVRVSRFGPGFGLRPPWRRRAHAAHGPGQHSLTLVVQQLAALLKGGRTPARLWDELWMVHQARADVGLHPPDVARWLHPSSAGASPNGPGLSTGSLVMLGAVRAAAFRGLPVSEAIRKCVPAAFTRTGCREQRIWLELAACLDIAEASGCPLAEVLARFAAQLEVEDDADAARQTALAGPKATVSLLTWLPVMGLGLGMALGVDPLAILFGTPLGVAALAAGVALTVAGRIWSARLVHGAAGAGP